MCMITSLSHSPAVSKDSIACFLNLLELGVDRRKIELWHNHIDGHGEAPFMDWPVTPTYCREFAKAFGVPIYFSWRHGGFKREMLRENQRTAPVSWETVDGEIHTAGGKGGKESTRRKFPQVTANLSQRWCSAALKVDCAALALNNQPRFLGKRTLFITGERAEESAARSKYSTFEPHRCHRGGPKVKRHVDAWRPVHGWSEQHVWEDIECYKVQPHPAYRIGWTRLSCMACIFGSDSQFASVKAIAPDMFDAISSYELEFECSIHRTKYLHERVLHAKPYINMESMLVLAALQEEYHIPIITDSWSLPCGAFGEDKAGPT